VLHVRLVNIVLHKADLPGMSISWMLLLASRAGLTCLDMCECVQVNSWMPPPF